MFEKLDAPADSNIAVSVYMALQEKANDFQVGQLSGSIKQIIDLATSFSPNKDKSSFRGIKGLFGEIRLYSYSLQFRT